MIKFPMNFEVQATASSGISSSWTAQSNSLPPIPSAIPFEFMGPGGGYSPEDLFALSILNCIIATYKVYCEKAKISFQEIRGKAVLTVDQISGQMGLGFTKIDITLDVMGVSDQVNAKKVIDNAIKDCAASNSIKSEKAFHINIY